MKAARQMTRSTTGSRQQYLVGKVWITYSLFYLGRVNFSVALPFLAAALDISRAEAGALGTVFYWVYGISHFFSGQVGSRFSPFRMVGGGLLLIALVNIAMSFQTSLLLMLALWGINGIAQSGGWSPVLRILAENLDRSRIKRVSTIMPFSYVFGTALTWTPRRRGGDSRQLAHRLLAARHPDARGCCSSGCVLASTLPKLDLSAFVSRMCWEKYAPSGLPWPPPP